MKAAIIGSNNIDLITRVERMPQLGETLEARSFALAFGGKGANQAVAFARLGGQALMVSCIGDDAFGQQMKDNLDRQGVDTSALRVATGQSNGVASIFVDDRGNNSILIVEGANGALQPNDLDHIEGLKDCQLIILQLEIPLETVYRAIKWGQDHHIPVLLNPAPAKELDFEQIKSVDFFVPNETELASLTGMTTETLEEVEKAAQALIRRGLKRVMVTLGSRGSCLVTAEGCQIVAPRTVTPVDTTGAGDGFIGSFAWHCLTHRNVVKAMEWANSYAALSTTRPGAQDSYLTLEEFERVLNS